MCIIVAIPPGKTPSFSNLVDATYENDDGSGWAIRTPNGLQVYRSAKDIDSVVDSFCEWRAAFPDDWAVWHSRLATHGDIEDDNTHPFLVPDKPWALVHNGVLPLNDGPFPTEDRSDSRILAEEHIGRVTWKQLQKFKEPFEKWLGSDKVVLISGEEEVGGPVIIFNEKKGKWDKEDDCWYSHPLYGYNWRHKSASPSLSIGSSGSYRSSVDPDDEDGIDWEDWDLGDGAPISDDEYAELVEAAALTGNGGISDEELAELYAMDSGSLTDEQFDLLYGDVFSEDADLVSRDSLP